MFTVLKGMRKPRHLLPGARYHIVARANRQEFILNSPAIKELFLATVKRAKKKYRFSVITCCLMSNHIHLILGPQAQENLSEIMKWILSVFAVRFNKIFGYKGHVWYDRFGSVVIQNARQFFAAFMYIAENPVRAGLVKRPMAYAHNGVRFFREGRFDILDPPGPELKLMFPGYTEPVLLTMRGAGN
jgi:REP element-mobilizing transposase RayT